MTVILGLIGGLLAIGVCFSIRRGLEESRHARWRRDIERREYGRGIDDQACWKWPVNKERV